MSAARPASITTRTGDTGTTALLYGTRVSKAHPQIEALGALDALNVAIGAAKLAAKSDARPLKRPTAQIPALLETIQKTLVSLMGEVACAADAVARYEKSHFETLAAADLDRLDKEIAALEACGLTFDGWATPGANALSLTYEQARVTARHAERRLVALTEHAHTLRPILLSYINRLSDLLWLLAREAEGSH